MASSSEKSSNPLSRDIHLLGDLLGEIIQQQHGNAAFELVEQVRRQAKSRRENRGHGLTRSLADLIQNLSLDDKNILIKAFSNYFQLINIAEDMQRVRVLREREAEGMLEESIDEAFVKLKAAGVTAADIRRVFKDLRVRLVLTAHPSEAKRKEVLLKLRTIANIMMARDQHTLLEREEAIMQAHLREQIEQLWQTAPTRASRKTVADEVDFGVYFITSAIMDIALDVYEDIERSLNKHYPGENWLDLPALLRYGSWIGGDRDGNPNVTPEVTLETLATMRQAVINAYIEEIFTLRDHLTQSTLEVSVSEELLEAVAGYRDNGRYPDEPYRQMMDMILHRLQTDSYADSRDLLYDLLIVDDSLRRNLGVHVANGALLRLIRKVRLFGLHLVPLDIREDARLMTACLTEMFRYYGVVEDYDALPEEEKQALLTREIDNPRPFFPLDSSGFSETTQRVIATWRMIATAHARYGTIAIDTVIASMSQNPSDVLGMLLMATEVGVADNIEIVPLLETIDDLYRGPQIMTALFNNAAYLRHLQALGVRHGPHQQVMIGYSDSSKDGGYLASNWHLYHAQQLLAETCETYGVRLQLFHGRGGSIGRGGGPTNRAILSQPPASIKGGVKITEQGEVIAYRYSNAEIGRRHLHQIMHAMLLAMAAPQVTTIRPEWYAAMEELSETSRQAYREFVYETPGFLEYWQQSTPINELSRLPISSRPAKRARSGGFEMIRAIPWIFSWMQSRAIIPSWFGIGSALQVYIEKHGIAPLREMYHEWPFFNALIENVQLDVVKADMGIAELYAALVADEAVRERMFQQIEQEHARTYATLSEVLAQESLLENASVIRVSIERRNPYVDPLNFIQVALLREVRANNKADSDHTDAVLRAVLDTINGIAAGMKTTG